MKVSVVLPVYNELRHGYLAKILAQLSTVPNLEILVVDGGSHDGTIEFIKQFRSVTLLQAPNSSRSARLNVGLEAASGEILFLHHPRSLPEPQVFAFLAEQGDQLSWGALRHRFDVNHPLLKFTSWYSNFGRGRRGIFYLDHCLVINRRLWPKGTRIPDVPIFEDTFLSRMLRKHSPPTLLPFDSTTSATRFIKNGLFRQSFLNQLTKLALVMGVSPAKINQWYERGLHLNQTQK